jgi:hypothetical protein
VVVLGHWDRDIFLFDKFLFINDEILFLFYHLILDASGHGSVVGLRQRNAVLLA